MALALYLFVGINQHSGSTDSDQISAVTGTLDGLLLNAPLLLMVIALPSRAQPPTLPTIIDRPGGLAAIFQKVSVESIFA